MSQERRPHRNDPEELARELGAAEPGEAVVAALERLTELKAAGLVSEENYVRERRRLLRLEQ